LRSIDVLRGVAILLVLAIHIPHEAPGGWRVHPFFFPALLAELGYFGVPLFIVISGFCIHRGAAMNYASSGSYRFDWGRFWKRRFLRLYPPYLAAIVLALACAFFAHHHFPDPQRFLGWDLATHLLLVHNLTQEFATSLGNGSFWSLGTEEQLYALYFLLLGLFALRPRSLGIGLVSALTVAWRLAVPHFPEQGPSLGAFHLGHWFQWPWHYWLHWCLGAVAVDAFLGNRRLPRWSRSFGVAIAMLALGVVFNRNTVEFLASTRLPLEWLRAAQPGWIGTMHNLGELFALLGFFCIVNWSLRCQVPTGLRDRAADCLAWVGRISYSVYLVHVPLVYILVERLPMGSSPVAWLARYFVYGGLALLGGYAFHLGVERWFLAGRLPRFGMRRPAISEASP
jgi:peptidoglycan/LPS O-acetylase OafA/YrhL